MGGTPLYGTCVSVPPRLARPVFADQVNHRALANVAVGQRRARTPARQCGELSQIAGRQVRAACQHISCASGQRNAAQLFGFVARTGHRQRCEDRFGLRRDQELWLVTTQDALDTNRAASPRQVFNQYGLAEQRLKERLQLARYAVGRIARRLRHDEFQRPRALSV